MTPPKRKPLRRAVGVEERGCRGRGVEANGWSGGGSGEVVRSPTSEGEDPGGSGP